jgi:hypothetical protein
LFHLGHYYYEAPFLDMARNMMNGMRQKALESEQASYYSNWNQLYLEVAYPTYEVAIVGPDYETMRQEIQARYFPQAIYLGGATEGSLPLLEDKLVEGETYLYVCLDKVCKLPVQQVAEAEQLMN